MSKPIKTLISAIMIGSILLALTRLYADYQASVEAAEGSNLTTDSAITLEVAEVPSSVAISVPMATMPSIGFGVDDSYERYEENKTDLMALVYEDSEAKKYDDEQERIRKEKLRKEKLRKKRLEKKRRQREKARKKKLAFERKLIKNFTFNENNVTKLSGLNEKTIKKMLKGTQLAGFEKIFLKLEKKYGINCMFSVGNAINESGWKGSYLSRNNNNLYGIKVSGFKSKKSCIEYWFNLIKKYYVGEGRKSTSKIQKKYCPPNSRWDEEISWIVTRLRRKVK